MKTLQQLMEETESARERFINTVSGLSFGQASFTPNSETWSITLITEHMARAEQSGISVMFKAIDGIKRGQPIWSGDLIH